ncbi:hypothetical protein [uncultured Winogradskyella sp.]|uniref:hypothetical protein n=1 Tax=uncultured Winogradskyella sp. TaxID=395353 RepID=UPI0026371051|nr:hypothetical protein [uncultured Winogradskyella sp.]
MYNEQRGLKTTEHNCKVKTTINIDSEQYDKDEAYSKSIDQVLNKLFTKDINPTI